MKDKVGIGRQDKAVAAERGQPLLLDNQADQGQDNDQRQAGVADGTDVLRGHKLRDARADLAVHFLDPRISCDPGRDRALDQPLELDRQVGRADAVYDRQCQERQYDGEPCTLLEHRLLLSWCGASQPVQDACSAYGGDALGNAQL